MNPFEYVNAINFTKENLMDGESESDPKTYNSFLINRALSYFPDTVLAANIINKYHGLDNKLQFDFLINIVRKRKRFSKWNKPELSNEVEAVKEYYGYNNEKAEIALSLLSQEQLEIIKTRIYKGGRN